MNLGYTRQIVTYLAAATLALATACGGGQTREAKPIQASSFGDYWNCWKEHGLDGGKKIIGCERETMRENCEGSKDMRACYIRETTDRAAAAKFAEARLGE